MSIYDLPARHRSAVTPPPSPATARAPSVRLPRMSSRYYSGGQVTRFTEDWSTPQVTANEAIRWKLRTTRDRARDLERNDDFIRRYLSLVESNGIGPRGARMKPNIFDRDGKKDKAATLAITTQWDEAGKKGNWTVCGTLSRTAAEKMLLRRLVVDGEALYRIHRGWGNRWGFAIQILDADLLDETLFRAAGNGQNEIIMGVERDGYGKPVAYWMKSRADAYGNDRVRVPAEEIRHLFIQERPNQVRGMTWLASGAVRKRMLDAFEHAVVVGARVAASKMGFITNDKDSPGRYEGDGIAGDGSTIMSAEPGEFEELDPGQSVQLFDPQYPPAGFAELERELKRGLTAGLNVSYHAVTNDISDVNYTSLREGKLLDMDAWRTLQWFVIDEMMEPNREAWLTMAMTTQAVALPITKLGKFMPAKWYPRGWDWVDPVKDAEAIRLKLEMKLTTRTREAAKAGDDIDEILDELEDEEVDMRARGLAVDPIKPVDPALLADPEPVAKPKPTAAAT